MRSTAGTVRVAICSVWLAAAAMAQEPQLPIQPARISGGVMAGQILSKVSPVYPDEAKQAHVSGTVVMRAIIGKDGSIQDLSVISGAEMLRASAMEAVKQWVYKPYLLNGKPTDVDTTITVNYNLGTTPPPGAWQDPENSGPDSAPLPAIPPDAVRVSGAVMAGQILPETQVQPIYPEIAKTASLQGSVVMLAIVGKDGRVESLRILSGPAMLRVSALEAVKQWRYKPYLRNGEPATVATTVTVNFSLPE